MFTIKYYKNDLPSIYTIIGNYSILNIIFQSISNANHGGALYLHNEFSQIYLYLCSFFNCHSNAYGGGLAILDCLNSNVLNSCFYMNSAPYCPGFVFWGYSYKLKKLNYNFSDYYNPFLCYHSSGLEANSMFCTNNNFTNSNAYGLSGGFFVGNSINQEIMSYTQIVQVNAKTFLAFAVMVNNIIPIMNFFNIINNSVTQGWIDFHLGYSLPVLNYWNFIKNPSISIFSNSGGSGSPSFLNCNFDFFYDPIKYNIISTLNNFFNKSYLDNFQLFNTFYCWNNNSNTYDILKDRFYLNFNLIYFLI